MITAKLRLNPVDPKEPLPPYYQEHNISRMKDVLTELFQVGEFAHLYKNRDLYYLWSQVCPEKYLDITRMKSFQKGILTIEVSSSAVLQEISNFHKTEILEKLKKLKGGAVTKLVFKLGNFSSDLKQE